MNDLEFLLRKFTRKFNITAMKKKLILLAILISQIGYCQKEFEGSIVFSFEFKDKKGVFTDEESKKEIGDRYTYFLKGKKYAYEFNGSMNRRGYYNGNDTVFDHFSGIKELWYNLITKIDEEKITGYKITNVTKNILGFECKQLLLTTNQGNQIIYFNNDYVIDPKIRKDHKLGNFDKLARITNGGFVFRHEINRKDYNIKMEAISFKEQKLKDSKFERPKLPIAPAPKN